MRHFRRFRHLLALFLFALTGMTLGAAHLYFSMLRSRVFRATEREGRQRIARWQHRWSNWWYFLMRYVGGMRITYEIDQSYRDAAGPFIVISNHFGVFDGLIIGRLLAERGHYDYRPVAKSSVGGVPVMGKAWSKMGVAFVARDRNKGDIDAVAHLAEVVREDGANAYIFCEGTVLTKASATNGARTLLPPKLGGFRRLVKALPGYPVLSITMYWREWNPDRLTDEGLMPPGSDVHIKCHVLPPPHPDSADDVLKAEWAAKQEWLLHAE